MEKIVLFGGSFDPVTIEHINVIKSLSSDSSVKKVIVIPTYLPPHKKASGTFYQHKVDMLNLALKGIDKVEISLFEIEQKRAVYSWETISHFKELYPQNQLCFAMGTDMLYCFDSWKKPDFISQNATIILFRRSSDEKTILAVKNFEQKYKKKVLVQDYISKDVSSTEIRVKNALDLDIGGLTDESVIQYIKQKNLYLGDRFYYYIRQVLPQKRRIHTAEVILCGINLAKKLNLDTKKVEIACLLHDNAKYLESKDYVNYKGETQSKNVVHQFLGEYIAKEKLCILDQDILQAIKYHTTGRANMSDIEKVVFLADVIEKTRDFNGVEKLRNLTEKDFDLGFKETINDLLKSLKGEIYYLTQQAYDFYVKGEL